MASFPVALRPWPKDPSHGEPLVDQMGKMSRQRGFWREFTKDILEREIVKEDLKRLEGIAVGDAEDDVKEDEEQESDPKKIREKIVTAKQQMAVLLEHSSREAMSSLDAIALLLSKDAPTEALRSISENIRPPIIPVGTLASDEWEYPDPYYEQLQQGQAVAQGWTMKALGGAADSLLSAATRLEKDIKNETKYWDAMLSATEKGWPVFRRPGERHTLGIQFASLEAGAQFRTRGFAAVRSNSDGSVYLDQSAANQPKAIRVSHSRDGQILGSSSLSSRAVIADTPLEGLIHQARDFIFDEEAYHEMTQELRDLQTYGVKLRGTTIHIPTSIAASMSSSKAPKQTDELLIELVDLDEDEITETSNSSDLAQTVALSIRMLLSHLHRQRLIRRSQLPPPLSDQKPPDIQRDILRPILTHLEHHNNTTEIRRHLEKSSRILRSANLDMEIIYTNHMADTLSSILKDSSKSDMTNNLVFELCGPLKSSFHLGLLSNSPDMSQSDRLLVEVHTSIASQSFGTRYIVSIPRFLAGAVFAEDHADASFSRRLTFTALDQLVHYLDGLVSLDIAYNCIPGWNGDWTPKHQVPEARLKVDGGKTRTKKVKVQLASGELRSWWSWHNELKRNSEQVWSGEESGKSLKDLIADYAVLHQ
ncbi:hypothetical protein K402DRAFT_393243 [Aulographum hederae CBS 113979]|uniref:Mediator of RNA polymerase II transcription subunit 17 n=1 Tax=Aulographum hederae CBS 113979 TaxID=1176131 RepID=A0A6G1H1K0_9PEZI|nr:hypothetical protein K402DRAFT_393243 [Aulographum hederae CBS 113979]